MANKPSLRHERRKEREGASKKRKLERTREEQAFKEEETLREKRPLKDGRTDLPANHCKKALQRDVGSIMSSSRWVSPPLGRKFLPGTQEFNQTPAMVNG
jgi:hypothetical protein